MNHPQPPGLELSHLRGHLLLGGKIRSILCSLYPMPSALRSMIYPLYSLLAALYRCPDVRPADQPRLACERSVYIVTTARSESLNRRSFNRSYLPLHRSALVRVAKIRGYSVHFCLHFGGLHFYQGSICLCSLSLFIISIALNVLLAECLPLILPGYSIPSFSRLFIPCLKGSMHLQFD